jgi:hypothetical protein
MSNSDSIGVFSDRCASILVAVGTVRCGVSDGGHGNERMRDTSHYGVYATT